MKKLLGLLFLVVTIYGSEVILYNGVGKVDNDNLFYYGFLYKSSSEDETLSYQIGLKRIKIPKTDFIQDETFITIKKETDLDRHLEFGYQTIRNDIDNGDIYMINYYLTDKIDYQIGFDFSNYDLTQAYQLTLKTERFLNNSPIYINPAYYGIYIKDDKIYNSVELKVGYIYSKFDTSFSAILGKTKYLVQDNDYYSCNLGNNLKGIYKMEFNYQINPNYIVNIKGTYYNTDIDMKVLNLALKYRY